MEETVRQLAKLLGATSVEAAGHDATILVRDPQGAELRLSIKGASQRMMAVLVDATGTTRISLDLAPVTLAFEDRDYPGRVTLRVGYQLVHLDGQPEVGIEVESLDFEQRSASQRLVAARGG